MASGNKASYGDIDVQAVPSDRRAFLRLSPALAFAWGGTSAHQVVCIIAEDHLTPQAKAGIRGPDRRRPSPTPRSPVGPTRFTTTPPGSGPAALRRHSHRRRLRSQTRWPRRKQRHRRHRNPGQNLADKSKPKSDRAGALKFLVHFMGDITNPSTAPDRHDDRGGNKRLVFYPGQHKSRESPFRLGHRAPPRRHAVPPRAGLRRSSRQTFHR